MTEIAKIELVAFKIGIKRPFSGCDQNLILRIYSFALWFLQKLQSFLFTGSEENMKCFASNSSGNTRLICQDISFLAPACRLQTMVRLKSFSQRREREGEREGRGGLYSLLVVQFDECRRSHDKQPSCYFMQIIFALAKIVSQ